MPIHVNTRSFNIFISCYIIIIHISLSLRARALGINSVIQEMGLPVKVTMVVVNLTKMSHQWLSNNAPYILNDGLHHIYLMMALIQYVSNMYSAEATSSSALKKKRINDVENI